MSRERSATHVVHVMTSLKCAEVLDRETVKAGRGPWMRLTMAEGAGVQGSLKGV